MEKKNTSLIIIIILSVCLLGLTGYVIYDKFLSKDDKIQEPTPKEESEVKDDQYVEPEVSSNKDIENLVFGQDECVNTIEYWADESNIDGVMLNGVAHKVRFAIEDYEKNLYLDGKSLDIYNDAGEYFNKLCVYDDHFIVTLVYPEGPGNNIIFDNKGDRVFSFIGYYKYENGLLNIERVENPIFDEPYEDYKEVSMHYTMDLKENGLSLKYAGD